MPSSRPLPSSSSRRSSLSSALHVFSRLTPRDQLLLSWLAEHHVLTVEQIDAALFGSRRYAQRRLTTLTELDVLMRFADHVGTADVTSMRYVLGPLGRFLRPDARDFAPVPSPGRGRRVNLAEQAAVLANHPRLPHLLGVNGFFADLHAHSRLDPASGKLSRWWSEQHATAAFGAYPGASIRPDGHGVWSAEGRHIGFFLEHDTGTEPLGRVLTKLPAYARLAQTGLRYPVLVRVPSARREANLLAELAAQPHAVIVATSVHGDDPACRSWAVPGHEQRLRLADLPCEHGPASALNSARFYAPDDDL